MFGLNKDGFRRMRYVDIIDEMNSRAKSVFGSNVNVSEFSPLGMIFKVVAFCMGIVWQLAEKVYYAAYKDTAEGYQLDSVGQYIGITRKPASYATGSVTFTGEVGTAIPLFFIVSSGDIQFWTQLIATIQLDGTVTVPIRALELGISGNLIANTITTIVNPLTGLVSVTNATETNGGSVVETDEDFRIRYDKSVSSGGASTISAIEAELLTVTNVVDAIVTENDTLLTVDGIPPKSFRSMLYGGIDADIAQAIFKTKAAGIQSFGTIVVPVTDGNGAIHNIGFSRVAEITVYVNVSLVKDTEIYPLDGDTTIQTAIIAYIGGLGADSIDYIGLHLSEDVIFTKIIGLCHSVKGVEDVTVTLSKDNITFTAANVAIATGEVAKTDYLKVVIV